jgi:cytochrome b6-f complex iron-sulfur subunit
MNSGVSVALAALVVLGGGLGLFVFTSRMRRDSREAVGYLANETVDRDQATTITSDDAPLTGRDVERQAREAQRGVKTALVPFDPVPPPPPATWVAPDADLIGQTRRQFLNRGIVTVMVLALGSFGAAIIAFLWPPAGGGAGTKITAGKRDDLLSTLRTTKTPVYNAAGKFYLLEYSEAFLNESAAKSYRSDVYEGLRATNIIALWQKCPHLGCRVPWCASSQWFECPCHGSQYNKVGQKRGGPAPRGMDMYPTKLVGDQVVVDLALRAQGLPVGANTTGQEPEGPHCV